MPRDRVLAFLSPLVLVALAVGVLAAVRERPLPPPAAPGETLYRELMELVEANYVVQPDLERAVLGAGAGLMTSLDRHSRLYTPAEWEEHRRDAAGAFVGIGIATLELDGRLVIMDVLPKGPAELAGIGPLDTIRSIDGREWESFPDVRELARGLSGVSGSEVRLGIQKPDGSEQVHLLKRRLVDEPSVRGALLGGNSRVGWIVVTTFRRNTVSGLDAELSRLRSLGMQSLVLDLRGNRGGLLEAAVAMAGRFLERVVIVTTRGRNEERSFRAPPQASDAKLPLVVLVDRNTASAAEVLAGALEDHARAPLLGERTYGKGVVQTELDLDSVTGVGVKLTTAHYFTPSGRCIEKDIGLPELEPDRVGGLCPLLVLPPLRPEESRWAEIRRSRIRWTTEALATGDPASGIPADWKDPWLAAATELLLGRAPDDRGGR